VVGIVGNIRGEGLAEEPSPGFYVPYQQRPEERGELAVGHAAVLLIEPRAGMENLADAIRGAIADVDPNQPVPEITALERIVSDGVAPERFRAILLGTFAVIALILVVAGIYGVIEYLVAERRHEFGIRMAMGATNEDIVKGVLGWGLRLAAVGIVLGLIAVFVVNRYIGSLLFGLTPTDPTTLLGAVVAVLLVTLTACFVPARKATRVDPVIALSGQDRSTGSDRRPGPSASGRTV
jgi:predicted lysophospholipase L1 biosynthesis ABC-type transport system permease subunit